MAPTSVNHRQCSRCRSVLYPEHFFRRNKVWKTCNNCSAKDAAWRKQEARNASTAFGQQATLDQHLADSRINQDLQAFDLLLQQSDSGCFHQAQADQQWKVHQNPGVALGFLLNDSELYNPSPLKVSEQQQRVKHETQHLFHQQALTPGTTFEGPISGQTTQPELYIEPFLTYDVTAGKAMDGSADTLVGFGGMNPNFYCDLYDPTGSDQQDVGCDYGWHDFDPDFDLDFDCDGAFIGNEDISLEDYTADGTADDGLPPLPESVLLNEDVSVELPYLSDTMIQDFPDDSFLLSCSSMEGITCFPETSQNKDIEMVGTDL